MAILYLFLQSNKNRNNILLNGKKYLFSIPVKNISSFAAINATFVSDKPFHWKKKILNTFGSAYSRAPFFKNVFPIIEEVINSSSDQSISTVAKNSVKMVMQYLEMQTVIVESSSVYNNNELKSEERVIDICKQEKVSTYINAGGGIDLYRTENFENAGINLFFMEPGLQPYRQFRNEFVPGLSIVDVLMFNPVEEVRRMLENYNLISSRELYNITTNKVKQS